MLAQAFHFLLLRIGNTFCLYGVIFFLLTKMIFNVFPFVRSTFTSFSVNKIIEKTFIFISTTEFYLNYKFDVYNMLRLINTSEEYIIYIKKIDRRIIQYPSLYKFI